MDGNPVSGRALRTLLAGKGHRQLTGRTLERLLRMGMPRVSPNRYDPTECMCWYLGMLRTEAINKATAELAEVLTQRMEATVDDLATAIEGKSVKQIEFLLGRHFRKLTTRLPQAGLSHGQA